MLLCIVHVAFYNKGKFVLKDDNLIEDLSALSIFSVGTEAFQHRQCPNNNMQERLLRSIQTFPFCSDTNVFSFQLFYFQFLFVIGVKRFFFNSCSGQWLSNSLISWICSEIFKVLKMYLKNAIFSLRFLNCSWILNFCQKLVF